MCDDCKYDNKYPPKINDQFLTIKKNTGYSIISQFTFFDLPFLNVFFVGSPLFEMFKTFS